MTVPAERRELRSERKDEQAAPLPFGDRVIRPLCRSDHRPAQVLGDILQLVSRRLARDDREHGDQSADREQRPSGEACPPCFDGELPHRSGRFLGGRWPQRGLGDPPADGVRRQSHSVGSDCCVRTSRSDLILNGGFGLIRWWVSAGLVERQPGGCEFGRCRR